MKWLTNLTLVLLLVSIAFVVGCSPKSEQIENDLPLAAQGSKQEFVEIGKDYDFVSEPTDVGGKLAFLAFRGNISANMSLNQVFFIYDGKELTSEYGKVLHAVSIGPRLALFVARDGKQLNDVKQFVVFDGKQQGPYDSVAWPTDVGGELAFHAKQGAEEFIVFNGRMVGREYDNVSWPVDVGGKLAFQAMENGKRFIVMEK